VSINRLLQNNNDQDIELERVTAEGEVKILQEALRLSNQARRDLDRRLRNSNNLLLRYHALCGPGER
jgi:hypothetical protein